VTVFVDEVQRLPSLLNTVQAILDDMSGVRFLLTGSSARKLKRGGANLLPGRVLLETLDPLSAWELEDALDLTRALSLGTLPGIYSDTVSGRETLESYATSYLREEVQAEALVRDVGSYARFLDLAADHSGLWINYSKLASDAEIPKETLRRYYQILEDTLLVFRVAPFASRAQHRRVSQRDRFLFFDLGVRNALLGQLRRTPSQRERGHLFEEWLLLQCIYFARAHHLPWKLLGFRTDAGLEVDGVLDLGDRYLAIECKLGSNVGSADLRGLHAFTALAEKPVQSVVVFGGERPQELEPGLNALPYRHFLFETLPTLMQRG